MAASDPAFFARAITRIVRNIAAIGIAGAVTFGYYKGMRYGAGFACGAAISYVSFWRWRKVAEGLGGGGAGRGRTWSFVVRFALLAGAAYAIVKYLEVKPLAVLLGLLAAAAAVIVEIGYELIYAGT